MADSFAQIVGHDLAKQVFQRYLNNKIPHSFIFFGPPGVGKRIFACRVADYLLCHNHTDCGQCPACRERGRTERSGMYVFQRGKNITINEIRELREDLTKSDWRGMSRLVLVEDAEAITSEAANAVLKILEEPGNRIYYIFIANNLRRVLKTIVSRSVVVPFSRLSAAEMDVILQQRGLEDNHMKKILMGLPARIDRVNSVSLDQHQKNVKNFWLLTMSGVGQKLSFVNKIGQAEKNKIMGLFFFWESCLRDYLLWGMGQDGCRWWQSEAVDEIYRILPEFDIYQKLADLSVIRERLDNLSKKIQIFNWLLNFYQM